ncbi:hypothetical protein ACFLXH_06705, partial [Chloroflexota bacterium]
DTATGRAFRTGENTLHKTFRSYLSTNDQKAFAKADRALAQAEITKAEIQEQSKMLNDSDIFSNHFSNQKGNSQQVLYTAYRPS